jgi:hypothetical protein
MKTWRVILSALALAATAIAAFRVATPARAAASTVSETRSVGRFDRIRTEGVFTTHIVVGAAAEHLTISGDAALIARVTTAVEGSTLVIGMKPGMNGSGAGPVITIDTPSLRGYANEGAGKATIEGLHGGSFSISNDGTASLTATGRLAALAIELNGVGKIDTLGVDARDVTVDNNGVGRVDVRASGNLTASVNGVGEVRYAGTPTHVTSQLNGVGRIHRLE